MIQQREQFVVNETVVHAALDDEAVLLDVETGIYFGLDPVGTRIWEMISIDASRDRIIDELLAEYEVPSGTLTRDVDDFIRLLAGKGLIRRADG